MDHCPLPNANCAVAILPVMWFRTRWLCLRPNVQLHCWQLSFVEIGIFFRFFFIQNLYYSSQLLSKLTIGFGQNEFDTIRRFQLSGPLEFLAACGGFLGLFMGISLLSIAELFYFFSIRLCCNIFKNSQNKKIEQGNSKWYMATKLCVL